MYVYFSLTWSAKERISQGKSITMDSKCFIPFALLWHSTSPYSKQIRNSWMSWGAELQKQVRKMIYILVQAVQVGKRRNYSIQGNCFLVMEIRRFTS